MAMGKRKSEQAPMWIPTTDLPVSPGHPFYARLNAILDEAGSGRQEHRQDLAGELLALCQGGQTATSNPRLHASSSCAILC